jgi:hypothetical protein
LKRLLKQFILDLKITNIISHITDQKSQTSDLDLKMFLDLSFFRERKERENEILTHTNVRDSECTIVGDYMII